MRCGPAFLLAFAIVGTTFAGCFGRIGFRVEVENETAVLQTVRIVVAGAENGTVALDRSFELGSHESVAWRTTLPWHGDFNATVTTAGGLSTVKWVPTDSASAGGIRVRIVQDDIHVTHWHGD